MKYRVYIRILIVICVIIMINIINLSGENILKKIFSPPQRFEKRAGINVNENNKMVGILNRFEQGLIKGDVSIIAEYCANSVKIDGRVVTKKQLGKILSKEMQKNRENRNYTDIKYDLIGRSGNGRVYLIKSGNEQIKISIQKRDGIYRISGIKNMRDSIDNQIVSPNIKRKYRLS